MDISHLRNEYTQFGLNEENSSNNPIELFTLWFEQAQLANIVDPNAMSLATSDSQNMPSVRTVLLKYFDHSSFTFFTSYESNKAKDIHSNPNVCAIFSWLALERQVIIKGQAEKIPRSQSLKYFLSRPYGSQLATWISHQSSVINDRSVLEKKRQEMEKKFPKGKVPLPQSWGGFKIIVDNIEFWQGRTNRLHDRLLYLKKNDNWHINRLSP